jgi:iron complex transport system ATP-binding protein
MTMLAVRGLACRHGTHRVLEGIDITFAAGEVTALVGPNGAGKTTLLRHLAGLDTPAAGRIEFDGRAIAGIERAARARLVAYLPQGASAFWPLTGRDLATLGRLPHGADLTRPLSPADAEAVARAIERVGGGALADRPIDSMSQGERARMMLARTLATQADVLLADEPVANLDPAYALDAMSILRAEAARAACVVVSLHDLGLAARFADRIVVLANGRVAADGTAAVALRHEVIDAAYGVGFRSVIVDGFVQPVAWSRPNA